MSGWILNYNQMNFAIHKNKMAKRTQCHSAFGQPLDIKGKPIVQHPWSTTKRRRRRKNKYTNKRREALIHFRQLFANIDFMSRTNFWKWQNTFLNGQQLCLCHAFKNLIRRVQWVASPIDQIHSFISSINDFFFVRYKYKSSISSSISVFSLSFFILEHI